MESSPSFEAERSQRGPRVSGTSLLDRLLHEKTILTIVLLFCAGIASVFWHLFSLSSDLVESTAIQSVSAYSEILREFRSLYTTEVVARVGVRDVEVTHDYKTKEGAIPLPATMTILLGNRIGERGHGTQTRLYSDYPFPWRKDGGPRDSFETEALRQLNEHSDQPYYRLVEIEGRPVLRYATADLMRASCISCHNSHPDSPKTDWKVGDVRGVLEVTMPLDAVTAQVDGQFRSSFVVLMCIAFVGLGGLTYVTSRSWTEPNSESRSSGASSQEGRAKRDRKRRIMLLVLSVVVTGGVFVFDLLVPLGVDAGILYVVPVSLSLWSDRRWHTFAVATVGTALTIGGFVASPLGGELWIAIANRLLAVFAIWMTAILCLWQKRARHREDQLVQEKIFVQEDALRIEGALVEEQFAQASLRESEARIRAIVDTASEGIITIDETGIVESFNAAASRMFGFEPPEVIGRNVSLLMPSPDREQHDEYLARYLRSGDRKIIGVHREVEGKRKDGGRFPIDLGISEVTSGDRRLFTGILRDLTKRKMLESQLLQAQKLESVGQLAAGIAHEINTPTQYVGDNIRFLQDAFADIRNCLEKHDRLLQAAKVGAVGEQLLEEVESTDREADLGYVTEEIPRAIEQSLDGVERVASIVRAMKEFAHPGTVDKVLIDINHAIQSTLTVATNEWKYVAEIVTDLDPTLPQVLCVPGDFNQAMLNLIVNAAHAIADAADEGSSHKGTITISTQRGGDWVEIHISDTGTGIPEDARPKIFDPFFTTKEVGKGTGQGLSIVHWVIVERHDGTIDFESEVGRGTTFIVRLPLGSSTKTSEEVQDEEAHTVR